METGDRLRFDFTQGQTDVPQIFSSMTFVMTLVVVVEEEEAEEEEDETEDLRDGRGQRNT